MFNNNKKTSEKKKKSGPPPSWNILSEGVEAKGEIHVEDDIRIAGKLEGDLMTKGKTIITSSGIVDGNIRGAQADIAGTVEGEVRISDKIIIRKSAVINGKVVTKNLLVEDGAQFDGTLRMSQDKEESQLSVDGRTNGNDTQRTEEELNTTAEKVATEESREKVNGRN